MNCQDNKLKAPVLVFILLNQMKLLDEQFLCIEADLQETIQDPRRLAPFKPSFVGVLTKTASLRRSAAERENWLAKTAGWWLASPILPVVF